jgi:hypothetical protein
MQDTVFSYSGEVQPALVCVAMGAMFVAYAFSVVAMRLRRRRAEKRFKAEMLATADKAKPGEVWFVPHDGDS